MRRTVSVWVCSVTGVCILQTKDPLQNAFFSPNAASWCALSRIYTDFKSYECIHSEDYPKRPFFSPEQIKWSVLFISFCLMCFKIHTVFRFTSEKLWVTTFYFGGFLCFSFLFAFFWYRPLAPPLSCFGLTHTMCLGPHLQKICGRFWNFWLDFALISVFAVPWNP